MANSILETSERETGFWTQTDNGPVWTKVRLICEIAREIRKDWKNVYFGAVPYLKAMTEIDKITDTYYCETANSVVRYFLENAATWRGETAKRVKAELKEMLK